MGTELWVAPAGAGKTGYVLELVRAACAGLECTARVVVPTHLQVRSWRRRLAEAGGALGVRLLTFDELYAQCLDAALEIYTELSDPVQHRLIRSVIDAASPSGGAASPSGGAASPSGWPPLTYYAPLQARPGFVHVLRGLIAELKAARIQAPDFDAAVTALGAEPRLAELARLYAAYQEQLRTHGWADRAGLGWLATELLETRRPGLPTDWPLVVVDGFDSFAETQLALLRALAGRAGRLAITLTGEAGGAGRPFVHDRFERTRRRLESELGVAARPLPQAARHLAPALAHLEAGLFVPQADRVDGAGAVEMIEAADRAGEARAALRWLKTRLVVDGLRPHQVALLARSMAPYRPFILQAADEFGLPVRMVDGHSLRANPAVAALLDLLRLMLPRAALPRRLVVEAWRSPYLDWSALPAAGAAEPIGIGLGDADALDAVARWGRVIGGLSQWAEALDSLVAHRAEVGEDEESGLPAGLPAGDVLVALRDKFRRFVQRVLPPAGERSYRDWTRWLEELIGPDPDPTRPGPLPADVPTSLRVVRRVRLTPGQAERDLAALCALKEVLRGLVWAEEALGDTRAVAFDRFFDELRGAVDAASYHLPVEPGRDEVLVADVVQARGLPFVAVAVLGLAEGEFPARLAEDPFLRDADRERLRDQFHLSLDPSTESAEAEFFYEAVTRARDRLLLTRPRLADNGSAWEASPYWEEVARLVSAPPLRLAGESVPDLGQAASWPELVQWLAAQPGAGEVRAWVQAADPGRLAALDAAARLFTLRWEAAPSPFDGDLGELSEELAARFGPASSWSAGSLEAYDTCPYLFFAGHVLGLQPRPEPAEGLDARQLGTIYHRILAALYPAVDDAGDLGQLLAALPAVAGQVLDEAPRREGFRETAWWAQTRAEIVEDLYRSLEAMAELPAGFTPYRYEAGFGLRGAPPLVLHDGSDTLRLRGVIDRVDRSPDGRLRIIDYKTAGPWGYGQKDVAAGKKLQLSIYAMAARDALDLGEPAEGFYWHIRHGEPSGFKLSDCDGGPDGDMDCAAEKAWDTVRAVRGGQFAPQPPPDGCPAYCPAAAFCWRYRPRRGE